MFHPTEHVFILAISFPISYYLAFSKGNILGNDYQNGRAVKKNPTHTPLRCCVVTGVWSVCVVILSLLQGSSLELRIWDGEVEELLLLL